MAQIFDRIESAPAKCGGRPCVRDLRIRVSDVLELLLSGLTRGEILEEHPALQDEDISACLRYALVRIDHVVLSA